jgi:protein-disulfide isomerase
LNAELERNVREPVRALFVIVIALNVAACGEGFTSEASKEQITQEQVRQYVLEHPELSLDDPEIVNSISRAQSKRERDRAASQRRSVLEASADLLSSPLTPYSGDADSTVTLIEFYDYQCSPCKANYPEVEQVRRTEANVRFVYGQLPIYGSRSIMAARAAIAAHRQNLFDAYHDALMTSNTRLDMDSLFAIAASVGLDIEKLRADMRDPQVIQYLEDVRMLADELGLTGTPSFIIGDAAVSGGATADELKAEVGRQRVKSDAIPWK